MITRALLVLGVLLLAGCATRPGEPVARHGDEIIVAGQRFRIGTPVVLWTDPGGYDAYRVERRFVPREEASWEASAEKLPTPNRYDLRDADAMSDADFERLRGGGWNLETLQDTVDLFVIHYDVTSSSRRTFQILHDVRGLSVHFLLDLDGTIYQTMDVKESGRHTGPDRGRSIDVEIANIGAYAPDDDTLDRWYAVDADGRPRVTLPESWGDAGIRTLDFIAHPARDELVTGTIQGRELRQYDYTPQQYEALAHLTAALSRILPKIRIAVPRDAQGQVVDRALTDEELARHHGLVGHQHLIESKIDPGPAFQWDKLLTEARRLRQ